MTTSSEVFQRTGVRTLQAAQAETQTKACKRAIIFLTQTKLN